MTFLFAPGSFHDVRWGVRAPTYTAIQFSVGLLYLLVGIASCEAWKLTWMAASPVRWTADAMMGAVVAKDIRCCIYPQMLTRRKVSTIAAD